MSEDIATGWDSSAEAWIREQGEDGDYGRRHVLDAPMIERLRAQRFASALDVGCGEGRFCRIMRAQGVRPVGIDPTEALIRRARQLDPGGDYRLGRAETLQVATGSFDLVVSYLSLIDIPDLARALERMVAALRPGGTLLIANLTSFNTAGMPNGWHQDEAGQLRFSIDHYLEERAEWSEWRGIRIRNWHRPLSTYMALMLGNGLELRHFAEPAPSGGDPQKAARYRRVPYFHIMEWRKPA
jgi:SAM-dependent methyltransferase